MPTQTVAFGAAQNQTLTVKLFNPETYELVATTQATPSGTASGEYTADFSNLTPGLYLLCAYNVGGTRIARWSVRTENQTRTYQAFECPDAGEWTQARAGILDRVLIASNPNQREVPVNGNGHVASVVHEIQPNVITAEAIAASAVTEVQAGLATLENQNAIKAVTDRLGTGLVQDEAVWQFTANMLELVPSGGGGSATVENQQAILQHLLQIKGTGWSTSDSLSVLSDLVAAGIGSALASLGFTTGTITGFPSTLRVQDSYTQAVNRSISVYVRDSQGVPITQVGSKTFADPDFKPTCVISQDGQSGRVEALVTWVPPVGAVEGYLRIEIPSNRAAYARAGVATVQVTLRWTGIVFTLATQTVTWLPAV